MFTTLLKTDIHKLWNNKVCKQLIKTSAMDKMSLVRITNVLEFPT